MLQEADFDHRQFAPGAKDADASLAVRFFMMPLQDDVKSDSEGRPIFQDTEMVEIRVRGDRNNIIQRPVRPEDKKRFRDAYRDFKDGNEQALTGTPLKEWPHMSASMIEELKYLGFHTVEQLAQASDAVISKVPGLGTMKQRAQAFLDFAKGGAPLEQMARDLEQSKAAQAAAERLASDMSSRMNAMSEQLNQLMNGRLAQPAAPTVANLGNAGPEGEEEGEEEAAVAPVVKKKFVGSASPSAKKLVR